MSIENMNEFTRKYSDSWFLDMYLRLGSVEEALKQDDMPISVASFHRLIQNKGIIPSSGRHTSLPEVLHFFREKALAPGTPLEELYRYMPATFKTSMVTLHRIYNYVEQNVVRRYATALILNFDDDPRILIGQEVTSNSRYGKLVGSFTVPMAFSKKDELSVDSIFRVLQQEVSTTLAISGEFSKNSQLYKQMSRELLTPFMHLNVVDTQVASYVITLPGQFQNKLSSYKLANHGLASVDDLMEYDNLRIGVKELLSGYKLYQGEGSRIVEVSILNRLLQQEPALDYSSLLL